MLTGKMPAELFPTKSECQSSQDEYFTENKKYRVFPSTFLVNANGSKPSSAITQFEEARESSQNINSGILINDPSCKLITGTLVKTKNYIDATYVGRIPLSFYGPKTPKGERFKLVIDGNDLDVRKFAKDDDLSFNSSSRDKTKIYSGGE